MQFFLLVNSILSKIADIRCIFAGISSEQKIGSDKTCRFAVFKFASVYS